MHAGMFPASRGGSTAAAWSPPRRRRWLIGFLAALALTLTGANAAFAQSTPRVLVFHGPSDATIDAGVAALETLGSENNFEVDPSTNAADFSATNLARYRAIVFLNNAGDRLSTAQEGALQGYVQAGGGSSASARPPRPSPATRS